MKSPLGRLRRQGRAQPCNSCVQGCTQRLGMDAQTLTPYPSPMGLGEGLA